MTVEYDLVVIGATSTAQSAAIGAAQFYARTAWVAEKAPSCDLLIVLRESSNLLSQRQQQPTLDSFRIAADLVASVFAEQYSPAVAQAAGVHYLEGEISFGSEGVTVAGQTIKSRAYILASEPIESLPAIPGVLHPKVTTLPKLYQMLQSSNKAWPQTYGVVGNGPQAVELSQSLQRLGSSVILLTDGKPLLPQEDLEVASLLQTYLEGSGILVFIQPLTAVQADSEGLRLELQIDGHKPKKITVNALAIATESFSGLPDSFASLNLRQTNHGLWVTPALQTSYPRLYACGGILGGYRIASVGQAEVRLAVQNALFEQKVSIQYHQVPYAMLSNPPLARVGLTETQALRYDSQTQVIRQTYQTTLRTALHHAPAGLCKVLVQPDGTILGAHLLGAEAPELIHIFAIALQQGIRLQELDRGFASPTFAQVIQSLSAGWRQQQLQKDRDRNERWFYRQRRKA